jgi:hypothetical protein
MTSTPSPARPAVLDRAPGELPWTGRPEELELVPTLYRIGGFSGCRVYPDEPNGLDRHGNLEDRAIVQLDLSNCRTPTPFPTNGGKFVNVDHSGSYLRLRARHQRDGGVGGG